jgi:YgiT-type zinc finger domain-containing protein
MQCTMCKKGMTKAGKSTVTLTEGKFVIVFMNVPSNICGDCGEEYISDKSTKILLESAKESLKKGVAVEVMDWVK